MTFFHLWKSNSSQKLKTSVFSLTGHINVFDNSKMLFNIYQEKYKLINDDELILSLASLFHDFNHSGGKLIDKENIEIALVVLKEFLNQNHIDSYYNDIKKLIKTTEFPHIEKELTILEKIIRDADTIGCVIDGWEDVVKNLAKEYGKNFNEFIPTQIGFLNSVSFNTEYSNNILKEKKEDIIKKLNLLKK